jgi:gamma-glutamyltranspeptidase/glutathione hydrolase
MSVIDPVSPPAPRKAVVASAGGIVASQSRVAASVGAEVLAAGGNAVDAAVATSFAVGVLEPWMSGIGGGGYLVFAPADGTPPQVIDCGMVAPAALDPRDYPLVGGTRPGGFAWPAVRDDRNLKGAHSVAVPGLVAGLNLALERFGTIDWPSALAPAIGLAERGLPIDWYTTLSIAVAARELAELEDARELYLPDGLPPAPAEEGVVHLPLGNLAHTLRRLAEAGAHDFYDGEIAASIARELRQAGGSLSREDLVAYRANVVPALETEYRGITVAAPPGLTAGPTLAAVLRALTGTLRPPARGGRPDAAAYRAYAASLAAAYEERLATLGHASPAPSCTTNLCVVDRQGNMVALTQTLLSRFGSKLLLPETGILLNNGIMWFDPRPDRPNSLAAGKRPLSNMCPVVLRKGGHPWAALGASGGRRIMPAVAQILSFLVDWGVTLEEAFHQPRLDVSGDGRAILDSRLSPAVEREVAALMPVLREPVAVYPAQFASPSAVLRDATSGKNYGMADIASPWSSAVAERD